MTSRRLLLPLLLVLAVAGLLTARVLLGTPFVYADLAVRAVLGEQIPGVSFIVMDDRLPAAAVGALAGAALGLSGTIFQTLLRNPLASPDVIGVTLGSSAAAVLAMAVLDAQGMALFWWTLLGGIGTVPGVLCGVVLLAILQNGLNLLGVSPYFFQIVIGLVILVSTAITVLSARSGRRYRLAHKEEAAHG